MANRLTLMNGAGRRDGLALEEPGPPLRVRETEDAYTVTAPVPGLTAADLEVTWTVHGLVLRGTPREEPLAEGERLLVDELPGAAFERVVTFGAPIDADRVEAQLEHGLLRLRLPKAPAARRRRIEVRPGS